MPRDDDPERQRLLKTRGHAYGDSSHEQPANTPNYTTFPDAKPRTSRGLRWLQLGLLTFWRSCHPLWFSFIFPTITDFILSKGIAKSSKDVGFYAGWIESAYSCAVLAGLYPASLISDAYGRKTTVLVGITAGAVATTAFGFARNFYALVAIRFAVGLSISLTPATILTTLIELSTKETQPLHFALNSLGWQIGATIAPFMGALPARPADRIDWLKGGLFDRFPYALPGLTVTIVPLLSVILGIFCAPETLPKSRRTPILASRNAEGSTGPSILSNRPLRYVLAIWFLIVGTSQAGAITEVLSLSRSRAAGGFGLSAPEIAAVFGLRSLLVAFVSVTVYAKYAASIQPERLAKICSFLIPINYLCYFALARLVKAGLSHKHTLWGIGGLTAFAPLCNPAFMSIAQLVASRASTKAQLSKANTAAELAANAGHGLGVLFGSQICALALKYNVLDGDASWLFPTVLASVTWIGCTLLTHEPGWREAEGEETNDTVAEASAGSERLYGEAEAESRM